MVMVNQIIHLGVGVENSQKFFLSSFLYLSAINEFNSFIAGAQNGGAVSTRETGVGI